MIRHPAPLSPDSACCRPGSQRRPPIASENICDRPGVQVCYRESDPACHAV
ncbi:MAG: hypothetical protein AVDCRST_MAG18-5065 [uncultured Thermomicrobiales bacterium]|uniref:Uncharacterized protein n=1 Tax=uncultured Thermomicrobiales bacterium TaxID=1645740 RepID=A0A6J4VVD6_9BACT|nr:MAG: hypothetical protein AVDCRST_MAG18-5065 [uncultured Thermomicrobiales bacterium]